MYPNKPTAPPPDHESASLMSEEPAAPPTAKAAGMEVESVSVRKAKNGGYIATCSKRAVNPDAKGVRPSYESNDYIFQTIEEVSAYLAQEFGEAAAAPAAPAAAPAMEPLA